MWVKKFLVLLMITPWCFGQALDSRYHRLSEINALLDSLDQVDAYSNIYHLETIGYSSQENLPIQAVKISDNADTKEDEGRVLFIGQCHAEEILGVETVLNLITYLLDPPASDAQHVNILRQNLEIWIIPTYNPEGLNVVYAGLDLTYRKNKHDFSPEGPTPNGVFDYDPSIGNDIDGVDFNRNYGFNWVFGDGFMTPDPSDYAAHYDYYRGLEPWSETEVQAIRDLALENHFLFSIAWHSSRSGRFSEKVYTPWKWEGDKFPPDINEMLNIGDGIASRIVKENGLGNYESKYSTSRKGMAHDWFYSATGCFQYLIECGTANLQPDSVLVEDTIDRLMPAQIYLMDRAIGYNEDAGQITGIVTDASGNRLTDVDVVIDERFGHVMAPRKTDEFGRFRRILLPGTYTLHFHKFGYEETVIQATINNSAVYDINVVMFPKTMFQLTFDLDMNWKIEYSNGLYSGEQGANDILQLPEGIWDLVVSNTSDGLDVMPWARRIHVNRDFQLSPHFPNASPVNLNISDSSWWEEVTGNWAFEDQMLSTQSGFIYSNADSVLNKWNLLSPWFDVSGSNRLVLSMTHRYEIEWDHDSVGVVLMNKDSVLAEKIWSSQRWGDYGQDYLWVNDTSGFDSVRILLSFVRDQTVAYRGWNINQMKLFAGYEDNLSIDSYGGFKSIRLVHAGPVYPNPSSGIMSIDVENWNQPAHITIFNLLGQEVYSETIRGMSPRQQTWQFNLQNRPGTPLSSGVYFIRISGNRKEFIRKCVLLKP